MCRVKSFCCCCSVRSAAITGAVWNALFVLSMIGCCTLNLRAYFTEEHDEELVKDEIDTTVVRYGLTTPATTASTESLSKQHLILGIFCGLRAVFGLLVLVLLCIGIHKGRPGYICPWLVMAILFIIPGVISIIALFILGVHWLELIGDLILYAFWLYVWIAVYSFYKDLKEGGPGTAYVA